MEDTSGQEKLQTAKVKLPRRPRIDWKAGYFTWRGRAALLLVVSFVLMLVVVLQRVGILSAGAR